MFDDNAAPGSSAPGASAPVLRAAGFGPAPAASVAGGPGAVRDLEVAPAPKADGGTSAGVLLAESDPVLRADLADIFIRAGFAIAGQARSGEEAVQLALALRPDLVVLDVGVPGVEGLTATGPISEQQIPVILLMAPTEAGLVHEAVAAGAMAWLVKPIVPPSLVATAHMVLARHAEIAALRRSALEVRTRMEEHKLIERAKGLLMARHSVAESVAAEWMQQTAQDTDSSMARVAAAVVDEYHTAARSRNASVPAGRSTENGWAAQVTPRTGADRRGRSRRRRSRGALQGG